MKRFGLFLILIIIMGNLPLVSAQTAIKINNIEHYPDSTGYDKIYRPDGTVFVYSQRYSIEYLNGKTWKQITTPINIDTQDNTVTRHYTDYVGTTAQVIYHHLEGQLKTDIVIHSGWERTYRIVWELDGITQNSLRYGQNNVEFYNGDEWIRFDWSDAYKEYGNIASTSVTDSANGKKLTVTFDVGVIKLGETLILDPIVTDSYSETNLSASFGITGLHPSPDADVSAGGQTFTSDYTGNLTNCKFYLDTVGNPTGTAYAKLYNITDTYGVNATPTGAALATSDGLNVATMGAAGLKTFTFSGANRVGLIAGGQYAIVFEGPTAGTIDVGNYIRVWVDNTAPTHDGNVFFYRNSAYDGSTTYDVIFYVYVNVAPTIDSVVSTANFARNVYGWVNVTVTDLDLVADLATVDILVNTQSDNFTLRWTQTTGLFSETSDPGTVCTLGTSTRVNIDADTDKIAFNFTITGGLDGLCNVTVTVVDDLAHTNTTLYADEFTFTYFNWITEVYDLINSGFAQFGIIDYMSQITVAIAGVSANFADSLTGIVTLINLQFLVIWRVFTWFTGWATRIINTILTFGTTFYNLLNGGTAGFYDLWTQFNFDAWALDLLPVFLVVYWISSISKRAKTQGLFTVLYGDLNAFANVFAFFMGMFSFVISFIENKVNYLFSVINI